MDLRDVITVSPHGISKTFNFSSSALADSQLFFEKSQSVTWDISNTTRIFAAERGRLLSLSAINGSSSVIKCPSYEANESDSIGVSTTHGLLVAGRSSGKVSLINLSDFSLMSELSVANNLSVCKAYGNRMVCGGKDVLFSVWDLEKSAVPIFTAKNVRPDTLDLKVPIWLSDASFVEGYESRLFVTSSKYGDFCVYDLRSRQRRPVSRSAWRVSNKQGKMSVGTGHNPATLRDLTVTRPITRCVAYISAPGGGLRAVASNVIGDICRLDFRVPHVSLISDEEAEKMRKAKSVGARAPAPPNYVLGYTPPSLGSVSALVCGGAGCANLPHAVPGASINDQPVVVSGSLDRYIRVYNRDTGQLINKIFTKAPVSTFLIRESATVSFTAYSSEASGSGEKSEQEAVVGEDVWEGMETVEEPPLKRTKRVKQK